MPTQSSTNTIPAMPSLADEELVITPGACARAMLYDDSLTSYIDYTSEANNDVGDDVVFTTGSSDYFYIGDTGRFHWVLIYVSTAGSDPALYSIIWEYWNGAAWSSIVEFDSDTGDLDSVSPENKSMILDLTQMTDWAMTTVNGHSLYFLRVQFTSTPAQSPLAKRIWVGKESVDYSQSWSDTMAIDDTQAGQFYFGVSPAWSDNMAIDDTQPGQFSPVLNFIRAWSDIMEITDLTDSQGMQFQINLVLSDIMDMADWSDLAMGGARHFARSFMDVMDVLDSFAWADAVEFSDILDITDQGLVFNIGLNLSDLMEIIDLGITEFGWQIVFQDIMTIADWLLWRGTYPAPVYLRFSARRPQITIYTKDAKKK